MKQQTYNRFRDIAYSRAGIHLGETKKELVSTRVGKRMRSLRLGSLEEYLRYLDEDDGEMIHFLDAISTNFTHFMREKDHFDRLEQLVEKWRHSPRRRFRVWCAASSTGEEPYSIAMTIAQGFSNDLPDVKVLATDINTAVLNKAQTGVYSEKEIAPLTEAQRRQYFSVTQDADGSGRMFAAKPVLRNMLRFKRLNLSSPPFPMKGPLDVVFCRNVMIYFDNHVRQRLTVEIERLLAPGGILIIGHSETLTGLTTGLKVEKPSVYVKTV